MITEPPGAAIGVGDVRARSREVFSVPMTRLESVVRVQARAPGREPVTRAVRLRAGHLTEVRMELPASSAD